MNLFWNSDERRLRALWRLILHATIMAGLIFVPILLIAEPLTALHRRGLFLAAYDHESYDRVVNMIVGPFFVAAVIGSVAIAGRWLDHRPFSEFGVRMDRTWWTQLGMGLGLGGLLMGIIFAVEQAAGWIEVTGFLVTNIMDLSLALALSFSLTKVICVGISEEFISRGYHLRNLTEATNLPVAIVISSAIFAIMHAVNENASVMSTAGIFINALLFVVPAILTGRLAMSIGLHIAWNLFEGAVFGFPVSGDKEGASVVGIHQLGETLVTGGSFGPEAGFIGMAASLVGVAIIAVCVRRHESVSATTTDFQQSD